jgi:hypothetical protein
MGSANSLPYEVVAAPFEVYYAPYGEAVPAIDAAIGGNWTRIGTSGILSYVDNGVTVSNPQSITKWRSAGDTAVRKVFRTEEDLMVRFTIADVTIEAYQLALNMNAITTVPASTGVAGTKAIGLSRGSNVAQRAILIRGASPYMDNGSMQFEIPLAFQTGSPEPVYGKKGEPAALALEWTAIIDPNASSADRRLGRLVAQTAAAS